MDSASKPALSTVEWVRNDRTESTFEKYAWLKKQTQFIGRQIAVKSYLKGYYDKTKTYWAAENKANSKHALSAVEWANCIVQRF